MFIETETTPNPNSLKFYPGIEIGAAVHFFSKEEAANSPLVQNLFKIEGVKEVFLGKDFITVTKNEDEKWDILKPHLLMIMIDHFSSNSPVFISPSENKDNIDYSLLSELEKQIVEIIDTRVRPSVAMDGGDIVYKGFEDGVVILELRGSCSGCPSSTITLKNGIESMLKHFVPEVREVRAINS